MRYISETPKFTGGRNKSGNDNLSKVLDILGNPHRKIKCIHVAGTNGKGSTVQMIKCLLTECGFSVGTFTSPHLVRINERIALCEKTEEGFSENMISDEDFVNCFDLVKRAVEESEKTEGLPLSYFEFLFTLAAVYFADACEKTPDYVVWETGLGGRLDATNLVAPEVCVITQIGIDHTKYLGETIKEIAFEKAGILKENTPVVYLTGSAEADSVIEERARELSCPMFGGESMKREILSVGENSMEFSLVGGSESYGPLSLFNQAAPYQADNCCAAVMAVNLILKNGERLTGDRINGALSRFSFAGRMERLGAHLVLDGAHNLHGIKRFCEAVKGCYRDKGVRLLFGVACDKNYEEMIGLLSEELEIKCCYVTELNGDRALSAPFAAALFRSHGVSVYESESIEDCLEKGYGDALRSDDILFCVGSLYLIGSIKELIRNDKF